MLESGITEGRIVHYRRAGNCRAAIIVAHRSKTENFVGLRVFADGEPGNDFYVENADYGVPGLEACWHWPQDHKVG